MSATGASLFSGLSRIAELESPHERVRAIARDLIDWGARRVDVRIFDQWREVAQATAGESPLRWHLDPRPATVRAVFSALSGFEEDGVSAACGELVKRAGPGFVIEGDLAETCLLFFQLIVATRVVGLVVIDTGPTHYDREALAHLRSYCDVAATLFDSERNALRASRDAERSDVLARIAYHTRRSLDRRTMLELIVGDIREAFKAARCVVYERDRGNYDVVHVIAMDDVKAIQAPLPRSHSITPGSLFARVFEKGEVVALERIGEGPEFQRARNYGMRAILSGPIVSDDGSIDAAVSIHFAREHQFDQVDTVLLRSITTYLGLALANARLYEREQHGRRRAEMLEKTLRTLRGIRTVNEILRTVTETIVAEFGMCGSAWSIRSGRFRCEAACARKEAITPSYAVGTSVSMDPEHLALLQTERILLTRDDQQLWRELASKEAMIAPLFIDQHLWGFLAARIDLQPGETDEDRARFLATLASHTALVVGNARAFEDQRRFALERSVLSEAARLILTFNDPEALAGATTRLVLGLCGADRVEIHVPRDGKLVRIGLATSWDSSQDGELPSLETDLLTSAHQTGGTLLENDGHVAILALPSTDHVAGILACYRDVDDTAPFDPDDVRFLESFCGLLGLGMRNCELFEAETYANYALAQSSAFKDDLLTMFTHDFKGPLTVIMGQTELMLEAGAGGNEKTLRTIKSQAERLSKLADDAMTPGTGASDRVRAGQVLDRPGGVHRPSGQCDGFEARRRDVPGRRSDPRLDRSRASAASGRQRHRQRAQILERPGSGEGRAGPRNGSHQRLRQRNRRPQRRARADLHPLRPGLERPHARHRRFGRRTLYQPQDHRSPRRPDRRHLGRRPRQHLHHQPPDLSSSRPSSPSPRSRELSPRKGNPTPPSRQRRAKRGAGYYPDLEDAINGPATVHGVVARPAQKSQTPAIQAGRALRGAPRHRRGGRAARGGAPVKLETHTQSERY